MAEIEMTSLVAMATESFLSTIGGSNLFAKEVSPCVEWLRYR